MRRALPLLLLAVLLLPASAKVSSTHRPAPKPYSRAASKSKCYACARDARGRIKRSAAARHRFQKRNPCPATGRTSGPCPGYQIDHRVPLNQGGADTPSNMQWLTDRQHKLKHETR